MAEQSSTVAAFRAIVMLGCVILIPIAAICGTSFPAVVKAIESGRLPTLADFRGPDASNARSDAPRFAAGAGQSANAGILPMTVGTAQTAGAGMSAMPYATSPPPHESSSVIPASYNDPTSAARANSPNVRGSLSPVPSGASALLPLNNSPAPPPAELDAQTASSDPKTRDVQFNHIHDRLRQLGAIYFLLEFWGDQQQEFRFYSKMSIGGDPHVFKSFESIDADPLKAMSNVLKEVEAWRNGGG